MLQKTKTELGRFRDFCLMKGTETYNYWHVNNCAAVQFLKFERREHNAVSFSKINDIAGLAHASAGTQGRMPTFMDIVAEIDKLPRELVTVASFTTPAHTA